MSAKNSRIVRLEAILVALAAGNAGWALFLWRELIASRAGAETTCAFGEAGSCAALWDASFASAIHRATLVPVAGWGLIWSAVALALPLLSIVARSEERDDGDLRSAVDLTAQGGVVGVLALLVASAFAGSFCSSCAITYVLTALYAVVAYRLRRKEPPVLGRRSAGIVAVALAVAYGLALFPGQRTPRSTAVEGQRALAEAAAMQPSSSPAPATSAPVHAATSDAERALERFLGDLAPSLRQALADSLGIYRAAPQRSLGTPRVLDGPSTALRFTIFTDVLCGHCAALHETIAYLRTLVPHDAFAVDSRHFPLDGSCNPYLPAGDAESVRCVAAKALICLEPDGRHEELAGLLYRNQEGLTTEQMFELAAPFASRSELEACIARPATGKALSDDTALAWQHEPDGTPLVLVNGRQGTSFGPFLYAMILAGGNPDHPVFAQLPPPNPHAHIH